MQAADEKSVQVCRPVWLAGWTHLAGGGLVQDIDGRINFLGHCFDYAGLLRLPCVLFSQQISARSKQTFPDSAARGRYIFHTKGDGLRFCFWLGKASRSDHRSFHS